MFLPLQDAPYEMTDDPGYCLIIDNETFDPDTKLQERLGSEKDSSEYLHKQINVLMAPA